MFIEASLSISWARSWMRARVWTGMGTWVRIRIWVWLWVRLWLRIAAAIAIADLERAGSVIEAEERQIWSAVIDVNATTAHVTVFTKSDTCASVDCNGRNLVVHAVSNEIRDLCPSIEASRASLVI